MDDTLFVVVVVQKPDGGEELEIFGPFADQIEADGYCERFQAAMRSLNFEGIAHVMSAYDGAPDAQVYLNRLLG